MYGGEELVCNLEGRSDGLPRDVVSRKVMPTKLEIQAKVVRVVAAG